MKLRTTLAVLALALVAWAVIRFLPETKAPPPARERLVPAELLAQWREIDLSLLSGQQMRLERKPGGGVDVRFGSDRELGLHLDYRDPADLDKVRQLLEALDRSGRQALSGEAEDRLKAGLEPPRTRVAIRGDGGDLTIAFGNDDPAGGGVLAGIVGTPTVIRTERSVHELLGLNLRDWRSRRVFDLEALNVGEIELVRYPVDGDGQVETITLVREGGMTNWRMVRPRQLVADADACQTLARQCCLLSINSFVSNKWDKVVVDHSKLPDHPSFGITLTAGSDVRHLDVGTPVGEGYPCRLLQRDENMCFTIEKAPLEAILATTVDTLRPRRLWSRIESRLVALGVDRADGTPRWRAEREGLHPKGAWLAKSPFQGPLQGERGSGSFGQVVAEVDRIEIAEFLPAGTPFTPQAKLTLQWKSDAVLPLATFEVALDGDRALMRDPRQPGDVFAMKGDVAKLLQLDLELCRSRELFPGDKAFSANVKRLRLEAPGRAPIEAVRKERGSPLEPGTTATEMKEASSLSGAASELFGAPASDLVRAAAARERPGFADPFARPQATLIVETFDGGAETLVVGSGSDAPDAGLYCRLSPRLPDDVWLVCPRRALDSLLRLAAPP